MFTVPLPDVDMKASSYYLWELPGRVLDQLDHGEVAFYKGNWYLVEWLASDKVHVILLDI